VAGISFEVEAGQILGFLGPNGAGKTTTLKRLSQLSEAPAAAEPPPTDLPLTLTIQTGA